MPSEQCSDGILYWIEIEPSLPRSGFQIADICQEDKKTFRRHSRAVVNPNASARKPASRHSHESGNLEHGVGASVLPDKFPHRRIWIPACAGMTKFQRAVGWAVGWASAHQSHQFHRIKGFGESVRFGGFGFRWDWARWITLTELEG